MYFNEFKVMSTRDLLLFSAGVVICFGGVGVITSEQNAQNVQDEAGDGRDENAEQCQEPRATPPPSPVLAALGGQVRGISGNIAPVT